MLLWAGLTACHYFGELMMDIDRQAFLKAIKALILNVAISSNSILDKVFIEIELDNLIMIATDCNTFSKNILKIENETVYEKLQFVVPVYFFKRLQKCLAKKEIKPISIEVTEECLTVNDIDGCGYSTKIEYTKFPNFEKIIPEKQDGFRFAVNKDYLKRILDSANTNPFTNIVYFEFQKDEKSDILPISIRGTGNGFEQKLILMPVQVK